MTEKQDTKSFRWSLVGWTLGGWIGCHLILIATHVVLIFLYSLFVAPGLPEAHYRQFAQESGPWFSIVAGGPVFFALAKALHKKFGSRALSVGLWIWTLYSLTDLFILLAFAGFPSLLLAGQWVTSQAIKLAALKIASPSITSISNPPGPTAEPGLPT